ncbi:hypothetical protein VM98_39285, partial [Streptomyces rubellomurinus subsp. indigoferus]
TSHLDETDLRRLGRTGLAPMPSEQGLLLFDAALAQAGPGAGRAVLLPAWLNTATVGALAAIPALPRGPVRAPRPAASGAAGTATLRHRFSVSVPEKRHR